MIKCDWFWKLLKQFCFGLLISFFTLSIGSFVRGAGATQPVWTVWSDSVIDSNYTVTFLKWWWLLTQFLWVWRNVLALKSDVLFWWTPNWFPYAYLKWDWSYEWTRQWFFDRYYSCDEIDVWQPSNCSVATTIDYSGDNSTTIEIFKTFFSKVTQWDYVYYDWSHATYIGSTSNWVLNYIKVCFSSHEIWKSLCFMWWYCWWVYNDCPAWRFTASQNYADLNFSNIPYWSIWYAPWQNWYMNDYQWSQWWYNEWYVDWFLTWSVFSQECTVWNAKSYAESIWMTRNLCYWWLPLDSSWVVIPVPWSGASVFDIFSASSDWMNFTEWFNYRLNIYNNRYVYNTWVWSDTPAPLYPYFNFYSHYWQQFNASEIQDYCRIIINNINLSSSWHWNSSWCPTNFYWWSGWGWGWSSWDSDTWTWWSSSFNQVQGVSWVWVWNITWDTYKSPKTYIQDFFNKAREVISTDFVEANSWFLPTYIVMFLLAIILFRFLRH